MLWWWESVEILCWLCPAKQEISSSARSGNEEEGVVSGRSEENVWNHHLEDLDKRNIE